LGLLIIVCNFGFGCCGKWVVCCTLLACWCCVGLCCMCGDFFDPSDPAATYENTHRTE
jgi:branched-subunit amino acid permease